MLNLNNMYQLYENVTKFMRFRVWNGIYSDESSAKTFFKYVKKR